MKLYAEKQAYFAEWAKILAKTSLLVNRMNHYCVGFAILDRKNMAPKQVSPAPRR